MRIKQPTQSEKSLLKLTGSSTVRLKAEHQGPLHSTDTSGEERSSKGQEGGEMTAHRLTRS